MPRSRRRLAAILLSIATVLALVAGWQPAGADEDPVWVPELGDPDLAELVLVASAAEGLNRPRDLAFHPERPAELWTVNQADDSTVILFDPQSPHPRLDKRIDRYANHFMEEVSSIAFGSGGTFATCQESRNTYDDRRAPNDFMGPTLWPDDLEVYGRVNQEPLVASDDLVDALMRGELCLSPVGSAQDDRCFLGSHIDMNHQSPDCMGIAHDRANAYWTFDGHNGHLVYYDFAADHGVGCDDHSDGIVRRYPEAEVSRVPGVPGHLALDAATGWLYYADTGSGRVMRLDTRSGRHERDLGRANERLAEYSEWGGAEVERFAGGFEEPSGLALSAGRLFVSDHATGAIVALDLATGEELGRLETGAEGIMGLTIGPEGRLWYVDGESDELRRVEPRTTPPTATPSPTPEPSPTPQRWWGHLPWLGRS